MTKGEWMTPEEYIAKLEEEVEQRKEYQQRSQSADGEQIERLLWEKYKLEEEKKKLNDKIEHLEFDIEAWKKLKAVWEKKEQKLQIEIWWLMWERDGLKMVVEKLHKELDECECSFWFENDEAWYRKRECKKLKEELSKLKEKYWDIDY